MGKEIMTIWKNSPIDKIEKCKIVRNIKYLLHFKPYEPQGKKKYFILSFSFQLADQNAAFLIELRTILIFFCLILE